MKEKTIVLSVLQSMPGEILDRGRYHSIVRSDDDIIEAIFKNRSTETVRVRLTLTALDPYSCFSVILNGRAIGTRYANMAGILESTFLVPEQSRLDLIQQPAFTETASSMPGTGSEETVEKSSAI